MDPVEVFLCQKCEEAPRPDKRIWEFFIRAFYSRKNFTLWLDEHSGWDYYLRHGTVEHSAEDRCVWRIREEILDELLRIDQELEKLNEKLHDSQENV